MSLPLALDINVLVRLLVNDDPVPAQQATALIDTPRNSMAERQLAFPIGTKNRPAVLRCGHIPDR